MRVPRWYQFSFWEDPFLWLQSMHKHVLPWRTAEKISCSSRTNIFYCSRIVEIFSWQVWQQVAFWPWDVQGKSRFFVRKLFRYRGFTSAEKESVSGREKLLTQWKARKVRSILSPHFCTTQRRATETDLLGMKQPPTTPMDTWIYEHLCGSSCWKLFHKLCTGTLFSSRVWFQCVPSECTDSSAFCHTAGICNSSHPYMNCAAGADSNWKQWQIYCCTGHTQTVLFRNVCSCALCNDLYS